MYSLELSTSTLVCPIFLDSCFCIHTQLSSCMYYPIVVIIMWWFTLHVDDWSYAFPTLFTEEEPGMEFIDMSVIDGGLRYVLGKQAKTGEFPVTGPVHNYELLVSRFIFCTELCTCYMYIMCSWLLQRERNNVAHTAFTVVAMKEYVDTFGSRGTVATNVVRMEFVTLLHDKLNKKRHVML